MANNLNNKDVKLQKLPEQELKQELDNAHSSSYSQSEKAYLLATCTGNILVRDTNGFRFVSKEDIHYLDINKYKVIEPPFEAYIREKNNLSENKILKTNDIKKSTPSKEEESTENKTEITDNKNLRNISLSLMENISYFLFQSEEEIEFFNNNNSSSSGSSGLFGYGLDLI